MSSPPPGASTIWASSLQQRRASDSEVDSRKGSTATDDPPASSDGSKPGPPPPTQLATSELEINIVSPGPGDEGKATAGEFGLWHACAWRERRSGPSGASGPSNQAVESLGELAELGRWRPSDQGLPKGAPERGLTTKPCSCFHTLACHFVVVVWTAPTL